MELAADRETVTLMTAQDGVSEFPGVESGAISLFRRPLVTDYAEPDEPLETVRTSVSFNEKLLEVTPGPSFIRPPDPRHRFRCREMFGPPRIYVILVFVAGVVLLVAGLIVRAKCVAPTECKRVYSSSDVSAGAQLNVSISFSDCTAEAKRLTGPVLLYYQVYQSLFHLRCLGISFLRVPAYFEWCALSWTVIFKIIVYTLEVDAMTSFSGKTHLPIV